MNEWKFDWPNVSHGDFKDFVKAHAGNYFDSIQKGLDN